MTETEAVMTEANDMTRQTMVNPPTFFPPPPSSKEPEYRGHIIETHRGSDGYWGAVWALPDHSTPEYRMPDPPPKVRASRGSVVSEFAARPAVFPGFSRSKEPARRADRNRRSSSLHAFFRRRADRKALRCTPSPHGTRAAIDRGVVHG